MAKPRIIIADTDVNYIIPLQLKFVEDFFEEVDLEIVTDTEYFDSLFSIPQKVDIMIISEELYNVSLQRHNIGCIFLMTEQYEEEQTDELNLTRIFKYTSIKEIFNEIIGKSSDILSIGTKVNQAPQIVLVFSASGGTGKTTIALGLAACLTQNYKRVLYLNASWLQSFQYLFENNSPITSNDIYPKLSSAGDRVYDDIKHVLRKEIFTYLPPFKASLLSVGLDYSIYEKIAQSAKHSNEYDYIIVDADTSFDDYKAKLISIADKVIVVSKQNVSSVYATNMLFSNINGAGSDKFSFVCNDFNNNVDNALISHSISLKFTVSEYVEHIDHFDLMNLKEISNNNGIKKVSFLVL